MRQRITEAQLHRIVKESVKNVLIQEGFGDKIRGAVQGFRQGQQNMNNMQQQNQQQNNDFSFNMQRQRNQSLYNNPEFDKAMSQLGDLCYNNNCYNLYQIIEKNINQLYRWIQQCQNQMRN